MTDGFDFSPRLDALQRRTGRKWRRYPADVMPAWIADMDFAPAPAICEAVAQAAALGDFGYGPPAADSGAPEAFAAWARRRWGWEIEPDAVLLAPDVVGALANCIEALTAPGEAVLVDTPAYPPLRACVRTAGRALVDHPLTDEGMDFDSLENTIAERGVRMILFCHPHNPTGRCYDEAALARLAALAEAHDVIVVSDEIHGDLTYPPRRHSPLASLGARSAARTVTLSGASKAFNIAGLRLAVCVAQDPRLREKLRALPGTRWNAFSTIGLRASLAAWSEAGEAWLAACLDALAARRAQIETRLAQGATGIRWRAPDAGYLAWLDCREAGIEGDPAAFFLEKGRVALSPGPDFGPPGAGYARLNFATSAELLGAALDRIETALRP